MNDDLTFLASAYLDGDVTPDERARVDGDQEALAEVDRLRTVRFLLGDVEQPSISTREAHLSSALDAWSRLPEAERTGARRDRTPVGIDAAAVAGAASVTAPTPLRGDRRRATSTRWLSGAAAALVLVLAGGLALQLRTASDDDSSTSTSADGVTADTEATSSGDAASADERLSANQADDAPAGGATNEATAELDTGVGDPAPPGEAGGLDQLQTPGDLADFAAAAVDAPVSPDVPAATSAQGEENPSDADTFLADAEFPVCLGVDVIVGPAVYGDVTVVVGIDEGRNLAIAYRAATCAEVARVRLP
jgi:hypothetical protein